MNKQILSLIGALTLSTLMTGCTTTVPFHYNHPPGKSSTEGILVAVQTVRDGRPEKEIDKIFTKSPADEVKTILDEEIASTGLTVKIITPGPGVTPAALGKEGAVLLIEPTINELKWEVPGYDGIGATIFTVSFLTGGVGGLIYGSTPTDVFGKAKLAIRMTHLETSETLEKTYVGAFQDRMAKLNSDAPSTKSEIIGRALKDAMQQFLSDFVAFVKERERKN